MFNELSSLSDGNQMMKATSWKVLCSSLSEFILQHVKKAFNHRQEAETINFPHIKHSREMQILWKCIPNFSSRKSKKKMRKFSALCVPFAASKSTYTRSFESHWRLPCFPNIHRYPYLNNLRFVKKVFNYSPGCIQGTAHFPSIIIMFMAFTGFSLPFPFSLSKPPCVFDVSGEHFTHADIFF